MLEIRNFTTNEINEKFLRKVADTALEVVNRERAFSKLPEKGKIEISLAIVGDARMRKLNKMYRGKNRVTDVLSFGERSVLQYLTKAFPKAKKEKDLSNQEFIAAPDGLNRLGEIIICYPQAKKQAKEADHSLKKEVAILLIHGILHLLGYEHERNDEEAKKMKEIEKKILSKISNS